jgi:hypothetical protein
MKASFKELNCRIFMLATQIQMAIILSKIQLSMKKAAMTIRRLRRADKA